MVSSARRRGTRHPISVTLPAGLPLIQADALLVEQAIGNVVGNALAHTPPETRIQIDAATAPGRLTLRITDDGPGIAPAILPHIFDKFVRAEPVAASRADGGDSTGLGLAIAKGIVEAHGGTIAAESPVAGGHGTRITFSFPREDAP